MRLIDNISEIALCFPSHVNTDRLTSDILRSIKDGHTYLELFSVDNEKTRRFQIEVLQADNSDSEVKQIEAIVTDFDATFYKDYTQSEFENAIEENAEYIYHLLKLPTFLRLQMLRLLDFRYTETDVDLRELVEMANEIEQLTLCLCKNEVEAATALYNEMYDAITNYQNTSGITYGFDFRKKCYESMSTTYPRNIDYDEDYRNAFKEMSIALSDCEQAVDEFEMAFVESLKAGLAGAYQRITRLLDSNVLQAKERGRVLNFARNIRIYIREITQNRYRRLNYLDMSRELRVMFYAVAQYEQRYIDAYLDNRVNLIV